MKQRQRKAKFNRTHIVKTIRITSDYADFLNRRGTSERAMYVSKALHQYMHGGKPTSSTRERK